MVKARDVNVCFCIPNMGVWTSETAKSVALSMLYFSLHPIPGFHNRKATLQRVEGSMLAQNRHLLVKKALQDRSVTHILFVDADMDFPMTVVPRLLVHRKPFVAANCTTRMEPILPVAFGMDGERVYSTGRHGLQQVIHVGLALALIEVDVFRRLTPPLFLQDWIPDNQNYCGEDVYLTQKMAERNIPCYVDHDLSVEVFHVGKYAYGHADVKEPKDGEDKGRNLSDLPVPTKAVREDRRAEEPEGVAQGG